MKKSTAAMLAMAVGAVAPAFAWYKPANYDSLTALTGTEMELAAGSYKVTNDVAFAYQLKIKDGATVTVYFENSKRMTVDLSAHTTGKAAIRLPETSTLIFRSVDGSASQVIARGATGAAATAGANGVDGAFSSYASGGNGGRGAGGAGAGIGGNGGVGGEGGAGGKSGTWNSGGKRGSNGVHGEMGENAGTLYLFDGITVSATAGTAGIGKQGGAGGQYKGGKGGGGGGAGGGSGGAAPAFGAGGGGGGGGAGGGGAQYDAGAGAGGGGRLGGGGLAGTGCAGGSASSGLAGSATSLAGALGGTGRNGGAGGRGGSGAAGGLKGGFVASFAAAQIDGTVTTDDTLGGGTGATRGRKIALDLGDLSDMTPAAVQAWADETNDYTLVTGTAVAPAPVVKPASATFLGFFTKPSGGVRVFDENGLPVPGAEVPAKCETLYAHGGTMYVNGELLGNCTNTIGDAVWYVDMSTHILHLQEPKSYTLAGYNSLGDLKIQPNVDGATLILDNATVTNLSMEAITCNGKTLNLRLRGENTLSTAASACPAILCGAVDILTIDTADGESVPGSLYAQGGNSQPAIGSSKNAGTINVLGGRIIAVGGKDCPGIGHGQASATIAIGPEITISGGTVIAGSMTGDARFLGLGPNDSKNSAPVLKGGSLVPLRGDVYPECSPTNASDQSVYRVDVELEGVVADGEPVELKVIGETYGAKDVVAYENKLYLWLTNGTHVIYANGKRYEATVGTENKTYAATSPTDVTVTSWEDLKLCVKGGYNVKLGADITTSGETCCTLGAESAGKELTIDLNGKTLTHGVNADFLVVEEAAAGVSVTLKDSSNGVGTFRSTGSGRVLNVMAPATSVLLAGGTWGGISKTANQGGMLYVDSSAVATKVTLAGGVINDCAAGTGAAISLAGNSQAVLDWTGTVITNCTSSSGKAGAINVGSSATVTLNGGSVLGCSTKAVFVGKGGTVTVTNAFFFGNKASALVAYSAAANLNLLGGIFDDATVTNAANFATLPEGYALAAYESSAGTRYVLGKDVTFAATGDKGLTGGEFKFDPRSEACQKAGLKIQPYHAVYAGDGFWRVEPITLKVNGTSVTDGPVTGGNPWQFTGANGQYTLKLTGTGGFYALSGRSGNTKIIANKDEQQITFENLSVACDFASPLSLCANDGAFIVKLQGESILEARQMGCPALELLNGVKVELLHQDEASPGVLIARAFAKAAGIGMGDSSDPDAKHGSLKIMGGTVVALGSADWPSVFLQGGEGDALYVTSGSLIAPNGVVPAAKNAQGTAVYPVTLAATNTAGKCIKIENKKPGFMYYTQGTVAYEDKVCVWLPNKTYTNFTVGGADYEAVVADSGTNAHLKASGFVLNGSFEYGKGLPSVRDGEPVTNVASAARLDNAELFGPAVVYSRTSTWARDCGYAVSDCGYALALPNGSGVKMDLAAGDKGYCLVSAKVYADKPAKLVVMLNGEGVVTNTLAGTGAQTLTFGLTLAEAPAFGFVNLTEDAEVTVTLDDVRVVPLTEFTVSYDAQDGKWADGVTVSNLVHDSSIGLYVLPEENPMREKYAFTGWYASWTNGAEEVTDGMPIVRPEDHTVYAKWASQSVDPAASAEVFEGTTTPDGLAVIVTGATLDGESVKKPFKNGELVFPESIGSGADGKFVSALAAEAYAMQNYDDKVGDGPKLTSVYLPGYMTRVGDGAFNACTNLTNVVFAAAKDYATNQKTALELGSRAFADTALETITFPVGTKTKLAAGAFANCPNLTNIFIYGEVECLAKGPFAGAGDGKTPITVHLSPTYAADKDFVEMLTASMNTSKVKVDSEPLGQASIKSVAVLLEREIVVEFSVLFDSPWGEVNANTVTLFYTDDLADGFVGTGKALYPTEPITQDPSTGLYTAKFYKQGAPQGGARFYRLTIGAAR